MEYGQRNNPKQKGLHTGRLMGDRYEVGDQCCQDILGTLYMCTDKQTAGACTIRLWSGMVTGSMMCADGLSHSGIVKTQSVSPGSKMPRYAVFGSAVEMTLREWMRSHMRMPVDRAIAMVTQVGLALADMHANGVYPGYLSPETIFVCGEENGMPVTGLPDLCFEVSDSARVARQYYSAARIQGNPPNAHSDVFALAIILYECVYPKRPFQGKTDEELLQSIREGVTFPEKPDVDSSVTDLLQKVFASDGNVDAMAFVATLRGVQLVGTGEPLLDDLSTSEIELVELKTGGQPALHRPASVPPPVPRELPSISVDLETSEITEAISTEEVEIISDALLSSTQNKKKSRKKTVILGAVGLAVIAGVVLALVLRRPVASDAPSAESGGDVDEMEKENAGTVSDDPAKPDDATKSVPVSEDTGDSEEKPDSDEPRDTASDASSDTKASDSEETAGEVRSSERTAESAARRERPRRQQTTQPARKKKDVGWAANPFGD